jgi:Fe2+ transport system protein FeoA
MLTLGKLAAGQPAIVVAVRSPAPEMFEKLAARGIVPGAEISVVQRGDPIAVALHDARWAISRAEADRIEVTLV